MRDDGSMLAGGQRWTRRYLAGACALAIAVVLAGLSGCSSGPSAAVSTGSVSSPATSAPNPMPSSLERASARRQVLLAEAHPASGSLRRVVAPTAPSRGYSLWSFRGPTGYPINMILSTSGRGLSWTGCAIEPPRYIDRCGGAVVAPRTLVLAGRAGPEVASVVVADRAGTKRPAVLGEGGWLYVDEDNDITADSDRTPHAVEARSKTGGTLEVISIAP